MQPADSAINYHKMSRDCQKISVFLHKTQVLAFFLRLASLTFYLCNKGAFLIVVCLCYPKKKCQLSKPKRCRSRPPFRSSQWPAMLQPNQENYHCVNTLHQLVSNRLHTLQSISDQLVLDLCTATALARRVSVTFNVPHRRPCLVALPLIWLNLHLRTSVKWVGKNDKTDSSFKIFDAT